MPKIKTIIGVDASTDDKNIGLALARIVGDELVIKEAALGSKTNTAVEVISDWISPKEPALLAIDAPLGWPKPLGQTLCGHRAGDALDIEANKLFRRETDRFVRCKIGKQSLDVGADKIARAAHATLNRLDEVREKTEHEIPLAWSPSVEYTSVIEVYPAATLHARGLTSSKYKGNKDYAISNRNKLIPRLEKEIKEIKKEIVECMEKSDNCLDAVVCALAGKDFLLGKCFEPPEKQKALAKSEGWIWVADPEKLRKNG